MKKQTPGALPIRRDRPKKGGRGRPLLPLLLLPLFSLFGCQGTDNPAPPFLPAGVTNISQNKTLSIAPAAAASGGTVYVTWTEIAGGQNFEVFLARSTNGGVSFSAPLNVSQSLSGSGNPRMAVSGSAVYIVWEEFIPEKDESDIFFRKAEDQGGDLIWTPPLGGPGQNLSASATSCKDDVRPTTPAPCPSQFPDIAVEGTRIFVVWAEENHYVIAPIAPGVTATDFKITNSDINMAISLDGGIRFTSPINVTGPKTGAICGAGRTETASLSPAVAAANGQTYLAWEDCLKPNAKILFRSFSQLNVVPPSQEAAVISDPIKNASRPGLAAQGNEISAVWEEFFRREVSPDIFCTNTEIYFTTSLQQGIDFASPTRPAVINLSETPCEFTSSSPRIATAGLSAYIAWQDNAPGRTGIALRRSADGGATFGAREDLSQTAGSASSPALAAFGGLLYAFWEDSTLGNLEIVFARR